MWSNYIAGTADGDNVANVEQDETFHALEQPIAVVDKDGKLTSSLVKVKHNADGSCDFMLADDTIYQKVTLSGYDEHNVKPVDSDAVTVQVTFNYDDSNKE